MGAARLRLRLRVKRLGAGRAAYPVRLGQGRLIFGGPCRRMVTVTGPLHWGSQWHRNISTRAITPPNNAARQGRRHPCPARNARRTAVPAAAGANRAETCPLTARRHSIRGPWNP